MMSVKAEGERDRVLKEVRAVFEREPRINLHKYPVREMAEFDAWYVFGVDKVANRLEVRP